MRSRLTAAALVAALALTGTGTAHAATPITITTAQPINTTCDGSQAAITAVLHNDSGPDEDAQVYLEPNPGVGGLGVPVQYNQPSPAVIHLPSGTQAVVHLPYENGSAVFNTIAVAHGAALPTSTTELENMKTAKTAAFSELSPGQYPVAPSGCTPPPWHPCPPSWPTDLYPVVQTCPVYVPPTQNQAPAPKATAPATTRPPTHPTSHPSTHATTPVTTISVTPEAKTPTQKPVLTPTTSAPSTAPEQPQIAEAVVTPDSGATTSPAHIVTTEAATSHNSGHAALLLILAVFFGMTGAVCGVVGKRRGRRHG